jgi:hypothetical protein
MTCPPGFSAEAVTVKGQQGNQNVSLFACVG